MKGVVVAVFMTLVVCSQCADNCHWGPSYWCKSESNAAECGSTQYCLENVWKVKSAKTTVTKVSRPEGVECDICEEVMKIVGDELTKNSTETQVKNALLSFCNSTGPLASVCNSFVDQYFDQIWQLIVTDGLNPDEVCSKLGLCTSKVRAKAAPRPLKKSRVGDSVTCTVCKMVAKEILNLVINNATETEAEVEIKKVCPYMGGFAGECRSLIDDFFPELWHAAMNSVDDPDKLCQLIKVCTAENNKVSLGQNPLCDVCNFVTSFLKPFVDSNSTEQEVKDALEKVCSYLPSTVSSECTGLVDTYFELIWDLVKQEVDSGEICNQLGFCNGTAKVQSLGVKPRPQSKSQLKVGDQLCDLCQLAVNTIKPFVDSDSTEKEVKDALNKTCSLLPSGLSSECSALVSQYFDLIWTLLKSEVDSGQICNQIGLCNSTSIAAVKKTKVGSDTLCSTCKMVVTYVRGLVDSNITEAIAKAAVEDLCKKAGPLADECNSIVDQYFPMIWMLIRSYADDEQICSEIKMCATPTITRKASVAVEKPEVGGMFCMVCEMVMKELISMLNGNTTKQAIEDGLDKVCDALPSSITDDCTEFVKKYGSEIIDLILSGTGAKAVCTVLGLCLGQEQQQEEKVVLAVQAEGAEECEICKAVIDLVKTLIETKKATAAQALDEVCKVVPSGLRSECKTFIDEYAPQLIELLEKAIDADVICREIKVCTTEQLAMKF